MFTCSFITLSCRTIIVSQPERNKFALDNLNRPYFANKADYELLAKWTSDKRAESAPRTVRLVQNHFFLQYLLG